MDAISPGASPAGTSNGERRRIDEVFTAALELEGEERDSYLDRECRGDPELRTAVEELLAAAFGADPFLEPGGAQRTGLLGDLRETTAAFEAGRRIDRYRVLREIDRGGMGVVYLAERADGQFEQRVALKVVRWSAGERDLTRLVRERQILASLEHPGIARLYDGGVTEEGHPYFVMEYVDGVRIDEHCENRTLDLRSRLRLLVTVCAAVEAAHLNLVVHRDLKPSNILVDANGDVKLLDFGIAKVLDSESAAAATATVGGEALTLQYASPEQWRGQPITVASDVYQLGLLAYELVAGARPYDLATVPLAQAERLICEEPPPPPSRHRPLDRDLDAIVLTALAKEPARRYASADRLRQDLERYLAGQPVEARRATLAYRIYKFVGRHAAAVATAVAVTVAVIGLTAAFTVRLAGERDRAEQARREAEGVAHYLENLFELADPNVTGGESVTAREMLDRGTERLDGELLDQPLVRARLLRSVGRIYSTLGHNERAEELLSESLSIWQESEGDHLLDVARTLLALGVVRENRGHGQDALPLFDRAREIVTAQSGPDDPGLVAVLDALARTYAGLGDYERAEALFRRELEILRQKTPEAATRIGKALAGAGSVLSVRGRPEEARQLAEEALELLDSSLGPLHPYLSEPLNTLGVLRSRAGDQEGAVALWQRALRIQERAFGPDHASLAYALMNLGIALRELGRLDEARSYFRRTVDILSPGGEEVPALGQALLNLGTIDLDEQRYQRAEAYYRQALELQERLLPAGHAQSALTLNNLGEVLVLQDRDGEARPYLERSLRLFSEALGESHVLVSYPALHLARIDERSGEVERAERLYRRAWELRRPDSGVSAADVAEAASAYVDFLRRQGRDDEAEEVAAR